MSDKELDEILDTMQGFIDDDVIQNKVKVKAKLLAWKDKEVVKELESLPVLTGILKEYDRESENDFTAGGFIPEITVKKHIEARKSK